MPKFFRLKTSADKFKMAFLSSLKQQTNVTNASIADLKLNEAYIVTTMKEVDTKFGTSIVCALRNSDTDGIINVFLPKSISLSVEEIAAYKPRLFRSEKKLKIPKMNNELFHTLNLRVRHINARKFKPRDDFDGAIITALVVCFLHFESYHNDNLNICAYDLKTDAAPLKKVNDYDSITPCHASQTITTPVLSSIKPPETFSVEMLPNSTDSLI
ncbi:hypothetical protein AGLY_002203 [Aphis glycines]|uniref:Uncharacterized protein n=1 Tax=Aphis glycines TaxID=307491 RepID=A0A6G0U389_APHGL|nr:hypothetical protein AGLY_002203 [Aphis glycines]